MADEDPNEAQEQLCYAEPGEGPWILYIYGKDGYHSGGRWFRKGRMLYPEEEIAAYQAAWNAGAAAGHGLEVRVCNAGDALVFHAKGQEILHGEGFWNMVGNDAR